MPTDLKCPYVAEWSPFSEDGEILQKTLGPEDVMPLMIQGMSFAEIAREFNAPMEAVKHAIAVIPDMMKWREMILGSAPKKEDEVDMLRQIQQDYLPGEKAIEEENI